MTNSATATAETVTLRPGQRVYHADAIRHMKANAVSQAMFEQVRMPLSDEAAAFLAVDATMPEAQRDDAGLVRRLGAARKFVTAMAAEGAINHDDHNIADAHRAMGMLYVAAMERRLLTFDM